MDPQEQQELPPADEQVQQSTPTLGSVGEDAPDDVESIYGVSQEEYDAIHRESEAMIAERDGKAPPERPRDERGRFAPAAQPEEPQPAPQLDHSLLQAAKDVDLDLTGIADNQTLYTKVQEARFTAAQRLGRMLGVDPGEMAEFFDSRAKGKQSETPPAEQPAEPEPEPALALTEDQKERLEALDPELATVVEVLLGSTKRQQDQIAALMKQQGEYGQVVQRSRETEMARVWDDAADAAGLTELFGIKPSAALQAAKAGNFGNDGVTAWSSLVNTFFNPIYDRLISTGSPDTPETVHRAMAEAKASAQKSWSKWAGGSPPQSPAQPKGVVRIDTRMPVGANSAPTRTPYQGNTYEEMLREQLLAEEKARWADNGGVNPYRPSY